MITDNSCLTQIIVVVQHVPLSSCPWCTIFFRIWSTLFAKYKKNLKKSLGTYVVTRTWRKILCINGVYLTLCKGYLNSSHLSFTCSHERRSADKVLKVWFDDLAVVIFKTFLSLRPVNPGLDLVFLYGHMPQNLDLNMQLWIFN